jgi:stage V sporulation protein B
MAVARYIFWLALAELSFYVSGFIVHAAAGRILGPADYGIYGLIVTLTILIASLVGNGIPIAMSKFLSSALAKDRDSIRAIKIKSAIGQIMLMGSITAVFFFGAPLIAWLLRDPTLTRLLRISAFIIPCFSADSFYFYYYTGIHQFNMQSILKGLRSVMRIAIIVGLGYFFALEGLIAGYIFVPLSVFLTALIIDRLIYARRFPGQPGKEFEIKKVMRYALPITGFLVLYEAMISLDLFAVKSLLRDDYLTGIFNGALTISRIPNYLFYALTIVLLPVISHSAASEDRQKTNAAVAKSLRIMTMLLVPAVALIIAYAAPLMAFFFGAEYAFGGPILQILAVGVGLLTLFYVMSFAFQGAGLTHIPLRIALFGMVLNAALNLILVPIYGPQGSAIATFITALFVIAVFSYHLKNDFNATLPILSILKMLFAGSAIFTLALFLPSRNLLFIPSGALLFTVYLAILYFTRELASSDIALAKSLIPGIKKRAVSPS